MSNSRDLTAQAHAVLQAALEESESKFLELVALLKDEQPPRSALMRDVDFFRATSAHLRALLATQSAHTAQIEMSFESAADAESQADPDDGPEAESFAELNASRRHYEERILSLRSEVDSHAATIEALEHQLIQTHRSRDRQLALLREREIKLAELSAALETSKLSESGRDAKALEHELAQEMEHAANLNQLANERAEEITRITEKFEEAQERYEEAKWQLGKAKRFEKILKRRKTLIANLISTIRAKQKSNMALKAGIDGLRNYKGRADDKQQELLRRIDGLEDALSDAREKITAQKNDKRATDEAAELAPKVASLETQIEEQVALIAKLETQLEEARAAARDQAQRETEIERLAETLETKNTFIGTLQKEFDEHQKNATKLRKARLEISQLNDAAKVDQKHIDALTRKNDELRQAKIIAESNAALSVNEHNETIRRLSATIKEYEKTIATLSEAVEHWKRKHDFLAAESPFGYEPVSRS